MGSSKAATGETLVAVLLAAGLSRRLGFPKQLCSYQGSTLLERTIRCLKHPLIDRVLLVTGAAREACWSLAQKCDGPVSEVYNPAFADGLGSSIAAAATHLEDEGEWAAAIFVVCDQIHLNPGHIDRLISASLSAPLKSEAFGLVASAYQGTLGIPALFPRSYFGELKRLETSSRGAKALLSQAPSLVAVDFPQGEVDVDTPEAFRSLGLTKMDAER